MIFSSMTFLFLFLPMVLGVHFCLPVRARNAWLLVASCFFYGWGEPIYLFLMLVTVLVNWGGALALARAEGPLRRLFLVLTVVLDLGILGYFKYFNFLADALFGLFCTHVDFVQIALPIGISFYTFQALSYVVDVYRRDVAVQRNPYKLALYVTLFPQLIAGPIVKYHDVFMQIEARTISPEDVMAGLRRFILGLSKKVLLANTAGLVADKAFGLGAGELCALDAWVGALAYAFQIFYDFSGYSDMAIGLGRMLGFQFRENFNYPYVSRSITEFWRRWHISLSTWFKEYLYIPLGGNRVSRARNLFNLGVVFLATGIWHGAAWTFVLWGVWHGLFILFEKVTGLAKRPVAGVGFVRWLYTSLVFLLGWVLFRADNLPMAWQYVKALVGCGGAQTFLAVFPTLGYVDFVVIVVSCLCATPLFSKLVERCLVVPWKRVALNLWCVFLFVLSVIHVAASSYNPFIYFRF